MKLAVFIAAGIIIFTTLGGICGEAAFLFGYGGEGNALGYFLGIGAGVGCFMGAVVYAIVNKLQNK